MLERVDNELLLLSSLRRLLLRRGDVNVDDDNDDDDDDGDDDDDSGTVLVMASSFIILLESVSLIPSSSLLLLLSSPVVFSIVTVPLALLLLLLLVVDVEEKVMMNQYNKCWCLCCYHVCSVRVCSVRFGLCLPRFCGKDQQHAQLVLPRTFWQRLIGDHSASSNVLSGTFTATIKLNWTQDADGLSMVITYVLFMPCSSIHPSQKRKKQGKTTPPRPAPFLLFGLGRRCNSSFHLFIIIHKTVL